MSRKRDEAVAAELARRAGVASEPVTEPAAAAPPATTATPAIPPPASPPAIPKLLPAAPASEPTIATTVAGKREYDAFFSLYASWLQGNREGDFIPLGFIPGPAAIVHPEKGVVMATPDVVEVIGQLPKPADSLPAKFRKAEDEWRQLIAGLGGRNPLQYEMGFAQMLYEGNSPDELAMAMTRFRYRHDDPELPLGVVLVNAQRGMRVEKVYNPHRIPYVPPAGEVLDHRTLADRRHPVGKLLWVYGRPEKGLEANFFSRFNHDGTPRGGHRVYSQSQPPKWEAWR